MATRGGGGQDKGGGRKPPKKKEPAPEGQERPTLGNPDADPVRLHREYVERHTGGGAPPTGDAYQRALEQWHQLPGAVRRPATEIGSQESGGTPDDEATSGTERPRDDEEVQP